MLNLLLVVFILRIFPHDDLIFSVNLPMTLLLQKSTIDSILYSFLLLVSILCNAFSIISVCCLIELHYLSLSITVTLGSDVQDNETMLEIYHSCFIATLWSDVFKHYGNLNNIQIWVGIQYYRLTFLMISIHFLSLKRFSPVPHSLCKSKFINDIRKNCVYSY